jgi:hypothetical protein
MKGKMSQPQIMAAAAGGLFFLLVAALGWFGWGSLGETQGQAQALADRKLKPELAAILSRPGGAGAARKEAVEIGKLGEQVSKSEEALVASWREGLAQASGEGQPWSQDTNQWKDRLIAANDRLRKRAGKKGDNSRVILADDFYLGLQEFKQQNPPATQVPALARQLSVSEKIVEILMDAKKSALEGYPTQCLLQTLVGPAMANGEGAKAANEKPKGPAEASGILREGYTLQLECSPEVLYGFMQRLAKDPWLFVVVDMDLENDLKDFPKRSEVAKKFVNDKKGPESVPSVGEGAEGGSVVARGSANAVSRLPLLMVLAGKERLKVVIRVDFVGWKSPAPGKPAEKGGKAT